MYGLTNVRNMKRNINEDRMMLRKIMNNESNLINEQLNNLSMEQGKYKDDS